MTIPQYYNRVGEFMNWIGVGEGYVPLTVTITLWLGALLGAALIYWLITRPIAKVLTKWADATTTKWDDYILTDRMFRAIGFYIFLMVICRLLPDFTAYYRSAMPIVDKFSRILITVGTVQLVYVASNVMYDACEKQNIDRHGMLMLRNIVRTVAIVIGALVIISIILNRNITYVLSGLGAMAAVLTLVFKDTILGLVAGIKLSVNKSLKKGDWIQVPAFGANGEVIDVSFTVVKVLNWDNSVVTVPPYALITGGFQNQEEMKRSGGRRVKRSVCIDVSSVRYLSAAEQSRFAAEDWAKGINLAKPNVNLTLFRRWLERHILTAEGFRDDMLNMVRELDPTSHGIPVEIYLFTSKTAWKDFERVQADLLDSILAGVSMFSLRVYQAPAGADFRR